MRAQDLSNEELRAIVTRALACGGDYSRHLLREQLEAEEFDRPIPGSDAED